MRSGSPSPSGRGKMRLTHMAGIWMPQRWLQPCSSCPTQPDSAQVIDSMICTICKIDQKRPGLATLTRKLAAVRPLEKHQIDATAKRIISAPLYTAVMSIKLPLNEMTVQEKLAAMESLWEDLSRSPEAIESPAWHKGVLDQRQQRIADGTAQFEDWEKAKAKIREKVR